MTETNEYRKFITEDTEAVTKTNPWTQRQEMYAAEQQYLMDVESGSRSTEDEGIDLIMDIDDIPEPLLKLMNKNSTSVGMDELPGWEKAMRRLGRL